MNNARREWLRVLTDAVHAATGRDLATCAGHAGVILEHLVRECGGQRVYVPVPANSLPTDEIVKLLREGVPSAEVARRFNVTQRTINNHGRSGAQSLQTASMAGSSK